MKRSVFPVESSIAFVLGVVLLGVVLLGVDTTTARAQQCDEDCATCQIERGRPHRALDTAGSVLGVFDKLALWDRRARNHAVSADTEAAVAQYAAVNGLSTTKVRINQYAPGDEWRRLAANKEVGAGWRYTFGAITTLGYTILPGRLLGRDSYNPYTDTVNIYSDLPPLAMEQAAHAKNIRNRERPGTYATLTSLPLVNLFPEKIAKDDVLDYVTRTGDPHQRREAYDVLTPQYGAEVGGQLGQVFTSFELGPRLAGAATGHVLKRPRHEAAERRRADALAAAERTATTDPEVRQASAEAPDDGTAEEHAGPW